MVLGGAHGFDDPETPSILQDAPSLGISIGDGVWIGASTTILDGAIIGRNSVIGAGAMVRGEIPPYSMAVGVPARVLYDRRERAAQRKTGC
jgi:acetyltransferase-like isoleucine patch superfamily enzyme